MDLYIDSPVCLHGAVMNYLSTGTTLPFYQYFSSVLIYGDDCFVVMKGKGHTMESGRESGN
jgi:hypothetical protein